jgi:hypothetical protein
MLRRVATKSDDTGMTPATEPVRGKEGIFTARSGIGLDCFDAMLFDMDGVITRSARGHGELWKVVFDDFLREFSARHNLPFKPFDAGADYHDFVDGKPRYDGVGSFLAFRGITIPSFSIFSTSS